MLVPRRVVQKMYIILQYSTNEIKTTVYVSCCSRSGSLRLDSHPTKALRAASGVSGVSETERRPWETDSTVEVSGHGWVAGAKGGFIVSPAIWRASYSASGRSPKSQIHSNPQLSRRHQATNLCHPKSWQETEQHIQIL